MFSLILEEAINLIRGIIIKQMLENISKRNPCMSLA